MGHQVLNGFPFPHCPADESFNMMKKVACAEQASTFPNPFNSILYLLFERTVLVVIFHLNDNLIISDRRLSLSLTFCEEFEKLSV